MVHPRQGGLPVKYAGMDGESARGDRNPMRRGCDRIQAVLRAVLLVVFLAGAPAAALAVSNAIYVSGLRAGQAQLAAWHRVPAVVLGAKPVATGWWYDMRSPMRLSVGWAAPGGSWQTGDVTVPRGAKAGGTTAVWIDAQGRLTHPPLSRAEVTGEVIRAAIAVPAALGLLLAGIAVMVSLVLDKRRLACWEADWSAVEPRWTGRR